MTLLWDHLERLAGLATSDDTRAWMMVAAREAAAGNLEAAFKAAQKGDQELDRAVIAAASGSVLAALSREQ